MHVLVTGTSLFFSRVLIQGFAKHGAEVTAADNCRISTGKLSRFTSRRLRTPSVSHDPDGYIDVLLEELQRRKYDLVVPSFEEAMLLSQHRHRIEQFSRLLLSDHKTMMRLHHKPSLYELCDQIGVPAPASIVPGTLSDLEQVIDAIRYPVILKLPMGNNSLGQVYANNGTELRHRYQELCRSADRWGTERPLVQEVVRGKAIYTLMYCCSGKKLGEIIYRPLRTYPAKAGTSAHRQTIEHAEIEMITRSIAREVNWTGFLGFDFLEDEETGEVSLIDANPRPNPGLTLGVLSGIDWAGLQLGVLARRVPASTITTAGVRDRSWMLDFAWLFDDSKWDRGWGGRFLGRLRELNQMRPLLTSWKGKIESDWSADLGLWYQILQSLWKSRATGESMGYCLLQDSNYSPEKAVVPASQVHLRRGQPMTPVAIGVAAQEIGVSARERRDAA